MSPTVKAAAIISRGGQKPGCFATGPLQFLVQRDDSESAYQFPSVSLATGETAAAAIRRELSEAFDLDVEVGPLVAVHEAPGGAGAQDQHQVTLMHQCEALDARDLPDTLQHNRNREVKLVWRTLAELGRKPLQPEGALAWMEQEALGFKHFVTGNPG